MVVVALAVAAVAVMASTSHAQNIAETDKLPAEIAVPPSVPTDPAGKPASEQSPQDDARKLLGISGSAGYIHQFDTSLSSGGSYSIDRAFGSFARQWNVSETVTVGLSVAYEYDNYKWTNGGSLSASPWNSVNTLSIVPRINYALSDRLSISVAPVMQISGEYDADSGESFQWGAIGAVRYKFSDTLNLGFGLLGLTQLEDSALFIPTPLIDWQINESFAISTIRGPEANPFAGAEAIYEVSKSSELALGGGFSSQRFRLSSDSQVSNGVGQNQNVPIFVRFGVGRDGPWRVDLVAGVSVFNTLELDDSNGNQVGSSSGDAGLILGVFGGIKF